MDKPFRLIWVSNHCEEVGERRILESLEDLTPIVAQCRENLESVDLLDGDLIVLNTSEGAAGGLAKAQRCRKWPR